MKNNTYVIATHFLVAYNIDPRTKTYYDPFLIKLSLPFDSIVEVTDNNNVLSEDPSDFFMSIELGVTVISLTDNTKGVTENYKIIQKVGRGLFGTTRLEYLAENVEDKSNIVIAFSGIRGPYKKPDSKPYYVVDLVGDNQDHIIAHLDIKNNSDIKSFFDGQMRTFTIDNSDKPTATVLQSGSTTTNSDKNSSGASKLPSPNTSNGWKLQSGWRQAWGIVKEVEPFSDLFSTKSYLDYVGRDKRFSAGRVTPIHDNDFYTEDEGDLLLSQFNLAKGNGMVDDKGNGIYITSTGLSMKYGKNSIDLSDKGVQISNLYQTDRGKTKNMGIIGIRSTEMEVLDLLPASNVLMPTPRVIPDLGWVLKTVTAFLEMTKAGLYVIGKTNEFAQTLDKYNSAVEAKK